MPSIAIITINYNNESGLRKTIDSVVRQTYADFEYIVIDGGSNDQSKKIIEENSQKIDYWVAEPDNGIYDAMNKGLKASTGELIYFLNSGDYFFNEDTLLHIWEAITKDGGCELYFGNILLVNNQGPMGFINFKNMDLFGFMHGMISHQTIIARRSVFETYGYFDTSFKIGGDYNWLLNLFLRKSVTRAHLNVTMACYLTGGLSETLTQVHNGERKLIRKKYFTTAANRLGDLIYTYKIHRFLRRSWIEFIISSLSYSKWKSLGLV